MFFLTRLVVGEAGKEIRSLGRDSKRVVMPRREGYCGYIASSCTRLPTVASSLSVVAGGGGAGRASTHDWGVRVQRAHEVGE